MKRHFRTVIVVRANNYSPLLEELAQSDKTLTPFAEKLQKLAAGFKLNKIRRLLEEYLNYDNYDKR